MQARKCFNERVARYASRNGFVYRQVRIGGARTLGLLRGEGHAELHLVGDGPAAGDRLRCGAKARPIEVKNHGRAFWEKVAELMPDYQAH